MATGAVLILDYQASGGVMLGATIIGSRAVQPIEQAVGMWKNVIAVRLARARLAELLNNTPKREEGMVLPAPKGHMQVQGIHYAPQGSRKPILSAVNFELAAGEALGIVGPSASGKSTLARLLVGAWPASAGVVRLDGANIYAWPRRELSLFIGYLPQDVELFTGTIRDNIARMGEGEPAAVVRAAELAHAHQDDPGDFPKAMTRRSAKAAIASRPARKSARWLGARPLWRAAPRGAGRAQFQSGQPR